MNKADLSPHLSEWRDRWAVGVSHTLSPAGVATLVLAAMALRSPDGAPVPLWGALVGIAVYALVPAAVLLVLARRSGAADVFDPSKAVRRRMLLAGTICYLMGYGVIEIVGLGSGMRWVGATFAAGAAAGVSTRRTRRFTCRSQVWTDGSITRKMGFGSRPIQNMSATIGNWERT